MRYCLLRVSPHALLARFGQGPNWVDPGARQSNLLKISTTISEDRATIAWYPPWASVERIHSHTMHPTDSIVALTNISE